MRAREVILALLIIAAGVLLYQVKTGNLNLDWHPDDFFFTLSRGEEFVFQETLDIPGPLPRELQVVNAHGGVIVRGTETDKIAVVFKKTIYRRSQEAAQKVADQLKMSADRTEAGLVLSTNRDTFRRKNFETFFEISVPKGFTVKIGNSYGLVKAVGTGTTDISNPHGQVEAVDVADRMIIASSYEDVSILNAYGACRVTAPHGKITVAGVEGAVFLENSYADVEIENVLKKVVVKGPHSKVTGKNLKAGADVENSYEPVILTDVGPTVIRSHHSDVEAKEIDGPLAITDTYARLQLGGIRGDLKIEGTNMEVRAESVAAGAIDISTSYENVEVLSFTGRTTIRMSHGDLVLEPEAVTGPIDVQAEYAAIRFGWPAGGRYPFEARTKNARVVWNLPERPALEETNGVSLTKAFQDETGKPSIALKTTYADIRIAEKRIL